MAKRLDIGEGVDIISSLPDSVLGHILSFLPTKIGVNTSILSRRWRYLFPFSNNLDFDDSLLLNPHGNGRRPNSHNLHFIEFVDRCIMLMNDSDINKLRLRCHHDGGAALRVNSWIRTARSRNVRELDLCICPRTFKPLCVFACSKLVVLKLGSFACCRFHLNVPSSVHWPCLKSLHLNSIKFVDDVSTERLFSSCPVLEDLFIEYCNMGNVSLTLSSPSLKRLTICDTNTPPIKLVLDAPSLLFLKCVIYARMGYTLKNLHSLSEAHVTIGDSSFQFIQMVYPAVLNFFEGISRVRSLFLSSDCGHYFGRDLDYDLPLLRNVTCLVLSHEPSLDLSAVIKVLQCTPNLEEFVFLGCVFGVHEDGCVHVPFCVSSRLKVIDYRVFCYDDGPNLQKDAKSLEYFLKNANVLERMTIWLEDIDFNGKVAEKWRMMKETIEKLALSKTCEINFLRESVDRRFSGQFKTCEINFLLESVDKPYSSVKCIM